MLGRILWCALSLWVCAIMALGAMAADQRWLTRFENGVAYAEDCTARYVSRRGYATNIDTEDVAALLRRPGLLHGRMPALAERPARCANTRLALGAMKMHP